jgi:pSer/pThr/pTyr-binding forkhead associated (FHA) protein
VNAHLICPSLPDCHEVLLSRFPAVLGRGAEATTRLDDRWLSRRHCELVVAEGLLKVRDLDSKHGTYVNGERVREAVLYPGDHLQIGLCDFTLRYEPDSAQIGALVGGS